MSTRLGKGARLPPDVNRILFVKNLPFKLTSEEYYDIFGKYGAIRQIRRGVSGDTRGTAYVIYEDVYDAKHALEQLQGFNVKGRYIVVLYHQITRIQPNLNAAAAAQQQAAATSSVNPYL